MISINSAGGNEEETNHRSEKDAASKTTSAKSDNKGQEYSEGRRDEEKKSEKEISSQRADTSSYTDYSRVEDKACGTSAMKGGKGATFPVKLHSILSNPDFEGIISWMPHGRSWRILKADVFEDKVLPLFFCHSRLSSFMRQVNGWGFRRIKHGPDYNTYYNELFLRGMPHLTKKMRRESVSTRSRSKRKGDEKMSPALCKVAEEVIRQEAPLPSHDEVSALSMNRSQVRLAHHVGPRGLSHGGMSYVEVKEPQLDSSLSPVTVACAQPYGLDASLFAPAKRQILLQTGDMNRVSGARGVGPTGFAVGNNNWYGIVSHDLETRNLHQRGRAMTYNAGGQMLWNPMSGNRAVPVRFERRLPSEVGNMLLRVEQNPTFYAQHASDSLGMLPSSTRGIVRVPKEVHQGLGVMLANQQVPSERQIKRRLAKSDERSIPDETTS